jgi:hypothetical protein
MLHEENYIEKREAELSNIFLIYFALYFCIQIGCFILPQARAAGVVLCFNFPYTPKGGREIVNNRDNGWVSGWCGQEFQELLLKQVQLFVDKPKMAQVTQDVIFCFNKGRLFLVFVRIRRLRWTVLT